MKTYVLLMRFAYNAFDETGMMGMMSAQSLRKMCPYAELFWSAFPRIRTEFGEMEYECGKIRISTTPNTDSFHVVNILY